MKYRIYANEKGWELIDTKSSLESVIKVIDELIANEIFHFIVIEHDCINNVDFPIITTIESYKEIKENIKKKKVKRLSI